MCNHYCYILVEALRAQQSNGFKPVFNEGEHRISAIKITAVCIKNPNTLSWVYSCNFALSAQLNGLRLLLTSLAKVFYVFKAMETGPSYNSGHETVQLGLFFRTESSLSIPINSKSMAIHF